MKRKVYLAGPIFSKYEIEVRKKESALFQKTFPNVKVFAPVNVDFNDPKANPNSLQIFNYDYNEMKTSNIFIFDLNGMDPGTLVELGIALEMKKQNKKNLVYAFLWDFRMNRIFTNTKKPYEKSWGVNSFVIGGIKKYGKLFATFEDVLKDLQKKIV